MYNGKGSVDEDNRKLHILWYKVFFCMFFLFFGVVFDFLLFEVSLYFYFIFDMVMRGSFGRIDMMRKTKQFWGWIFQKQKITDRQNALRTWKSLGNILYQVTEWDPKPWSSNQK